MSRKPERLPTNLENRLQPFPPLDPIATPLVLNLEQALTFETYALFLAAALRETSLFPKLSDEAQDFIESQLQALLIRIVPALQNPNRYNFTDRYLKHAFPTEYAQLTKDTTSTYSLRSGEAISPSKLGSMLLGAMKRFAKFVGAKKILSHQELKTQRKQIRAAPEIPEGGQRATEGKEFPKPAFNSMARRRRS